jgi:peptidoglycan/xylan/chitin deacetylase (PgdA/CDA1 family)/protein-L-isoaspartate O-methyltransferase
MSRGTFVVSLDFELHWGVRDLWSVEQYRANLLGARAAVPALLALFEEFGVHATWAIVGLLFCESRDEMMAALPTRTPSYAAPRLSPYAALAEVGDGEREDPFHFAPSLIRRIADTPGQEIGTHTFSHYYCLEPGQSVEEFRADVEAACRLTRAKLGRETESIVFPRNQMTPAHLAVCGDLGLIAYRATPDHWAYRARPRAEAQSPLKRAVRFADAYVSLTGRPTCARAETPRPVAVLGSRYLRPYRPALRRLEPLRLRRITAELAHAATTGGVFHLWWHPHDFGIHTDENLAFLRRVLACFVRLREREGMESLTMADAARRRLGMALDQGPRRAVEDRRPVVIRSAPRPAKARPDDDVYAGRDTRRTITPERRAAALVLVDGLGFPGGRRRAKSGCGAGATAIALAQRGHVVRAIDPVPGMIARTRRLALEAGVAHRVVASLGDGYDLAFADASFALVLALGVTPRVDAPDRLLREVGRVLRPGGRLIASADDARTGADRVRRPPPGPRLRTHAVTQGRILGTPLLRPTASHYMMMPPRGASASGPVTATLVVFERQTCR